MKFIELLEEVINEGIYKKSLETKVEKKCKCDGGASLDPEDHDEDCPARELLDDPGSEIDYAEYQSGEDR